VVLAGCDSNHGETGGGSGTIGEVCDTLQTHEIGRLGESGVEALVQKVSGERLEGGLAATILVGFVQENCNYLLEKAVAAIQSLFSHDPGQVRVADLSNYADVAASNSLLAAELGANLSDVEALEKRFCADAQGTQPSDPSADLHTIVPSADLSQLTAVRGVVAAVAQTCQGVDGSVVDGLMADLLSYLIANALPSSDVVPPFITSFSWRWIGQTSIALAWSVEPPDAKSFELWVWTNNHWVSLNNYSGTVSHVYPSGDYLFALRVSDASGNLSPWIYLHPCVRCA
jgi:hypothetical protein